MDFKYIEPLKYILPILGFMLFMYFAGKNIIKAGYNNIVKMVKDDPEKFKRMYLAENQVNNDKIMNELKQIDKIKKVKIVKRVPPESGVRMLATTIDGGIHWYEILFNNQNGPMKMFSIKKVVDSSGMA